MALIDDAALIDEYLQWRSIRELTPTETTPQAFMKERVKEIAVDRLEAAIRYINGNPGPWLAGQVNVLRAILEGGYGQDTDREDARKEPLESDDQNLDDWERELLRPNDNDKS